MAGRMKNQSFKKLAPSTFGRSSMEVFEVCRQRKVIIPDSDFHNITEEHGLKLPSVVEARGKQTLVGR